MMNFSVLMSVYAKETPSYLHGSLDSVFNQTRPPQEVVLVEDGPLTPELYRVIQEFKQEHDNLKIVSLPQNVGLGRALNEGMKHCSYDYVARMDSDDECYPTRFEKQIGLMEMHPELDVVGSLTTEFMTDDQGKKMILSLKRFPETVEENERFSRKRCPVEHPAVVLKKQAVLDAGGYQHFLLYEDYHLWARMFVLGAKFYNIQEPLLYFRMSESSYARRGGVKYALTELKALLLFHQIGFLNLRQLAFCICTRMPIRLLPYQLRVLVYKKLLRKS